MGDAWDDADFSELHVAATHAYHGGCARVQVAPTHVIEIIDALRRARAEVDERHARLVAVADKLNALRARLVVLAASWERDAEGVDQGHVAQAMRWCAAELIEHAKEGT